MSENSKTEVVLYGSSTCPFTIHTRKLLDAWKIEYRWVDVDADAAAEQQIADWNEGRAIRPTLDIGGAIFVHPEHGVLREELKSCGMLKD